MSMVMQKKRKGALGRKGSRKPASKDHIPKTTTSRATSQR